VPFLFPVVAAFRLVCAAMNSRLDASLSFTALDAKDSNRIRTPMSFQQLRMQQMARDVVFGVVRCERRGNGRGHLGPIESDFAFHFNDLTAPGTTDGKNLRASLLDRDRTSVHQAPERGLFRVQLNSIFNDLEPTDDTVCD
jgi:hypothetical protein